MYVFIVFYMRNVRSRRMYRWPGRSWKENVDSERIVDVWTTLLWLTLTEDPIMSLYQLLVRHRGALIYYDSPT
jgi:hypothetical protein